MARLPGALPNTPDSMFPSPKDHWIIGPFDQDISGNMAKKRLRNQTDSLISQSTGLVSINDLDPPPPLHHLRSERA